MTKTPLTLALSPQGRRVGEGGSISVIEILFIGTCLVLVIWYLEF